MKQLIAIITLCLTPVVALAEEIRLVNGDGSPLSDLCIAAADNDASLQRKAAQTAVRLKDVECNGWPLDNFARHYRRLSEQARIYAASLSDNRPETRLCLAAATSDEHFSRLKAQYFGAGSQVEDKLWCNGMPLHRFVDKYRGRLVTASDITASR